MADQIEPEEVPASPDVIEGSGGVDRVAGAAGADELSEPSNAIQAAEHDVRRKARLLQTPFNSGPEASRAHTARLKEARDALMAAYVADGMSREEAALAVDTFIAREAPNTLGKMGMAAAEWLPGIGEAMSAAEAAKLSAEIDAARAAGDYERAEALQFDFVLAAIGAIPLIGKGAKLFKLADRLVDAIPPLRRQAYRRKLLEAQKSYGEEIEGLSLKKEFGDERWNQLSRKTRKSMVGIVNVRKGQAGERLVRKWIRVAELEPAKVKENAQRAYSAVRKKDQKKFASYLDDATAFVFQESFGGWWLKRVKNGKDWEVKTDRAQKNTNQNGFEKGLSDQVTADKVGKAEVNIELPDIDDKLMNLRVPVIDVDEKAFRDEVMKSMRAYHPEELVQEIDQVIATFFEHGRKARANGDTAFVEGMTTGSLLLAISATLAQGDLADE